MHFPNSIEGKVSAFQIQESRDGETGTFIGEMEAPGLKIKMYPVRVGQWHMGLPEAYRITEFRSLFEVITSCTCEVRREQYGCHFMANLFRTDML